MQADPECHNYGRVHHPLYNFWCSSPELSYGHAPQSSPPKPQYYVTVVKSAFVFSLPDDHVLRAVLRPKLACVLLMPDSRDSWF